MSRLSSPGPAVRAVPWTAGTQVADGSGSSPVSAPPYGKAPGRVNVASTPGDVVVVAIEGPVAWTHVAGGGPAAVVACSTTRTSWPSALKRAPTRSIE